MILPNNTTMTLPNSPLGALRATRTRWWQRLLVAMLVVGLVGLPSARLEAAEKQGNDPLAQPVQIIGGVAGGVSALAGFVPVIATALGPVGIAALATVALAAALYNLFSCLGSIGGRKCSAATIAMAAVGVGLAGANFAYQMDATSWFGTGEYMGLGTPQADAHVQTFNAANETTRTGTFMSTAAPAEGLSAANGRDLAAYASADAASNANSTMVRASNLTTSQVNDLSYSEAIRGYRYEGVAPHVQVAVPNLPAAPVRPVAPAPTGN